MRPRVIPAGDDHAVVVGSDPDEPIVLHDVRSDPWPYSQTLACLDADQAEAVGRALLSAAELLRGHGR